MRKTQINPNAELVNICKSDSLSRIKRHQSRQARAERRKQKEATARREVNEKWEHMESTPGYRKAANREMFQSTIRKIEVEVLDGNMLNLNIRNQSKPVSVQIRILRRIVEKRQAQANHKKNGRSADLTTVHITISCTSQSMADIRKKRSAA
ncbi:MAG: hypothetical protein MJZ73_04675 [Bacteroidaceae bacterium]|nr:hypothetical protein [Bacteroidaceae bacterium]